VVGSAAASAEPPNASTADQPAEAAHLGDQQEREQRQKPPDVGSSVLIQYW
jgi:hypothetical protein